MTKHQEDIIESIKSWISCVEFDHRMATTLKDEETKQKWEEMFSEDIDTLKERVTWLVENLNELPF